MGPYPGGQAQYLRVPYADFNALKLPGPNEAGGGPSGHDHEADFALLADIFPTGWHALELARFKPGESVAIFGAGPVGLMAAYSGVIRGASRVFVVDKVKERLDVVQKIGCEAIDFMEGDPVEQIVKMNGGEVDRAVDAVGYQAVGAGPDAKEKPNTVLDSIVRVTRPTGGLGIPGLYVPSDPGAPDEKSGMGQILVPFGKLFEKVSIIVLLSVPVCQGGSRAVVEMVRTDGSFHLGSQTGHGTVRCQDVQSILEGSHYCWESEAQLCGQS